MKILIAMVGIMFSLSVLAADLELEASWKTKLRNFITQIAGAEWGEKFLGKSPIPSEEAFEMPQIPQHVKQVTDVTSYTKITKEPTEFDKLPATRKRQFDYNFVEELYLVTRKTEPKDEDLANWLNALDQGGSREGVYQGLVLDEVYSALEGLEERTTPRLLDFCLKFSQKFFNQTFKKESLESLNLFSLKRVLTEKGLDLMEYYETKDLDSLYRWYALVSSDLAKEYANHLKTQIRLEASPKYHYEWAKSMPVQHIKSEFIIKLHSVMNGLQVLQ